MQCALERVESRATAAFLPDEGPVQDRVELAHSIHSANMTNGSAWVFSRAISKLGIDAVTQMAQSIQLCISRPDQTSPSSSRPAPADEMKNELPKRDQRIRHHPHEARVLLEPARTPQPLHRAAVVLGADVALRAVFRHDVSEARGHDEYGEAGGGAPVVVDAVGGVVGVGLEVDEASLPGPGASHAVAGLIGSEGSERVSAALAHWMESGGRTDWAITIYTSQAVLATSQGRRTKFLMTSRNVLDVNHERKLPCHSCLLVFLSTCRD